MVKAFHSTRIKHGSKKFNFSVQGGNVGILGEGVSLDKCRTNSQQPQK